MLLHQPIAFLYSIYERLTDKPLREEHKKIYKLIYLMANLLFYMKEEEAMERVKGLSREKREYIKRCYQPNLSDLLNLVFFKMSKVRDKNGNVSIRMLSRETGLATKDLLIIVNTLSWYWLVVPTVIYNAGHGFNKKHEIMTGAAYLKRYRFTAMGLRYLQTLKRRGFKDARIDENVLMGEYHLIEARLTKAIAYLKEAIAERSGAFVYDMLNSNELIALPQLKGFRKARLNNLLNPIQNRKIRIHVTRIKDFSALFVIRHLNRYARHPNTTLIKIYNLLQREKARLDLFNDKEKAVAVDVLTLFLLGYTKKQVAIKLEIEYDIVLDHIKTFIPEGRVRCLKRR